jgi:hypothetical protein
MVWLMVFWLGCAAGFRTADMVAEADPISRASDTLMHELSRFCDVSQLTLRDSVLASAPPSVMRADRAADPYHESTHVVLSVPASLLLTEETLRTGMLAHFVGHPEFRKHLTDKRLQLPRYFMFALFVLYQQYSDGERHGDALWRAWAEWHALARTGEQSLAFWSTEELHELEEERLLQSAEERRRAVAEQYESLFEPLCALFPDFFPVERIGRHGFAHAIAVATSQAMRVDGVDEPALLPLPLQVSRG